MKSYLGMVLFALTAFTLGACSQTSNPSTWDSGYFGFKIKDRVLSGTYNPNGFDAEGVQDQIRVECIGRKVSNYAETKDGQLIAFTADCPRGTRRKGGFVEVQKKGGEISYEGLYF